MDIKNKKLCIGVSTNGTLKARTAFSIAMLMKKMPDSELIIREGCLIHQNRRNIVVEAQKSDCTHLLFIDSDMIFTPEAVETILKRERDIIGAQTHYRRFPIQTTVRTKDKEGNDLFIQMPDGTFQCSSVGAGFMLVNMDVFKKISQPWFFFEHDTEGNLMVSEDAWFCNKAREAGYVIYCDPTINIGHLGDYIF